MMAPLVKHRSHDVGSSPGAAMCVLRPEIPGAAFGLLRTGDSLTKRYRECYGMCFMK